MECRRAAAGRGWLRLQLEDRGRGTQAALAAHLGLSASVTIKLVNGSRRIMADEADLIRAFFEPAPDDATDTAQGALALGPASGAPGDAQAGAGRRPALAAPPLSVPRPADSFARPDIPVWASAAAGDEDGTMILTDSPIDFIRRSELMQGVANPFAFYIVGDSMLERFEQGDQAVINPTCRCGSATIAFSSIMPPTAPCSGWSSACCAPAPSTGACASSTRAATSNCRSGMIARLAHRRDAPPRLTRRRAYRWAFRRPRQAPAPPRSARSGLRAPSPG